MKKIIAAILMAAVFTSCAKKTELPKSAEPEKTSASVSSSGTVSAVELTPADMAKKILDKVSLSGETVAQNDISEFGFKKDSVKDFSYTVCGTGAYPDKLLVVEFETAEDAEEGKKIAEEILLQDKKNWKDYAPKEMYKLDDALVTVRNNVLFYGITPDNATARDVIEQAEKNG